MRLDAEQAGKIGWSTKNDPRRLKIGSLMRKWNIDEVPQFWNVLKGEMSLIGPRPERPELVRNFKHEIPHYNACFQDYITRLADRGAMGLGCVRMPNVDMRISGSVALPSGPRHLPRGREIS
jgi:Bacterial sugar transferase